MKWDYTNKLDNIKAQYRYKCKCGHSMVIYPFEHKTKKICSWCGRYAYKNKKDEFKDTLIKLLGMNK